MPGGLPDRRSLPGQVLRSGRQEVHQVGQRKGLGQNCPATGHIPNLTFPFPTFLRQQLPDDRAEDLDPRGAQAPRWDLGVRVRHLPGGLPLERLRLARGGITAVAQPAPNFSV